jgi:surface protein
MKKFYFLFLMMLFPLAASADDSGSCGENVTWTYVEESQKLIISGSGPMDDYVKETSLPISSGSYGRNKVPWKSYIEKIQVVEINEGVTTIGAGAFSSIKTLASVTIPNSVTSIGGGAFFGPNYKDLTSVTIPSSVTSIGTYAFLRGLSSINVDEGNQAFTSVDGVLFNKDMSRLIAYPAKKEGASYIIPKSVTVIENGAFAHTKCTSLTIPNSVTTIGENAFFSTSISSYMIPSSVSSIGVDAFDLARCSSIDVEDGNLQYTSSDGVLFNKDMTTLIYYPSKKPGESYTIPNSVTTIDIDAFHASYNLTSVTIPNSVTSIGETAFFDCNKLASLNIPSSVTSIGRSAFRECDVLTSMIIPDHVPFIDNMILSACKSLTTVTLGSGVTSLGYSIFANSGNLKDVYCLAVDVPQTNSSTFEDAPIENMTLHVPAGSVDAYKAAERWNGFGSIVAIEGSSEGESSVALDPYVIWCEDNTTFYFLGNGDDISNGNYKGHTVTGMWHGETVTKSPENPESFSYKPMPWSGFFSECSKVVFDESFKNVRVTSTSGWFSGCNMQTIEGIEYLNTSEVTSMSFMFGCPNLLILDVSHFDTRKVKYMQDLFGGCKKLETIDVSNFDTSNVVDMAMMFRACNALKTLDLSNLNTSKVTNLTWMFRECSALTTVDLTNLNTSNVITMNNMFESCSSLTSLDLTKFNTEKVTEMEGTFYDCSSLKTLDVSHFNTSNVTTMTMMFAGCSGLTSLDVSKFNTVKVTEMRGMFARCSGLTSLDLRSFNTENVTEMDGLVTQCTNLETLDLSSFNTANVTSIYGMFNDCSNLKTIYASDKWNISNVPYEFGMEVFVNCTKLVGGEGTTYKEGYFDLTYAHIDGGSSNPGYFTFKDGGESPAEETEEVITITGAGQTTWCSAYDLDFTDVAGLKAYIATGYDRETGVIWLTRVKKVPAGEGILLIGDEGDYRVPRKSTTAYYMNMFKGTLKPITINETDAEYTNYYLSSGTSGVGFYKVKGSVALNANRAYLPLLKGTASAGTRFIGLGFDDEDGTTGVKEVKSEGVKSEEWYTLQGQRVAKPGKGLYIHNGRKVVIR